MIKVKPKKNLISLVDLSDEDINYIISKGLLFANGEIEEKNLLNNFLIGVYFRKTSTRTRTSFSAAAIRMGADIISFGPNDLQENTGESIEDTVRVLSGMLDCIVARTAGTTEEIRKFSSQNRMAVINAMTMEEHPTQALADITTLKQHFGELSSLRILYLGEGNNTAAALALLLPRFSKIEVFFYTPPGYGLDPRITKNFEIYSKQNNSFIKEEHDINKLPNEIDVIYTTRWQTTGTVKTDPNWYDCFAPYAVSSRLIDKYPAAIFMHDLPAHRGEEVDASVIDGASSIVFRQAENKLHSAKAVLDWSLNSNY